VAVVTSDDIDGCADSSDAHFSDTGSADAAGNSDTGRGANDEARGSTVNAADDMGGGSDEDVHGGDVCPADAADDAHRCARSRAVSQRQKLNEFATCTSSYDLAISSYVKKPSVVAIFSGALGDACLLAPVPACRHQFLNAVSSRKNSYASAMSSYVYEPELVRS